MKRAIIFDMFETLITHYNTPLYFSAEMAADAGISVDKFQEVWRATEYERSIGTLSLEIVIEMILKENHCYSEEVLIGLISNCFSEEADVIRKSALFPYFDAVYLSYEQGVQKPDDEIFKRCMDALSVKAEECVYIGDGGSYELETAERLGMKAVQAAWYLREGTYQPTGRKKEFIQAEKPLDVLRYFF